MDYPHLRTREMLYHIKNNDFFNIELMRNSGVEVGHHLVMYAVVLHKKETNYLIRQLITILSNNESEAEESIKFYQIR